MALFFLKGNDVEIYQNCSCSLSSLLKCDKFCFLSREKTPTKGTDTIAKVGISSSLDFDSLFFVMECYLIVYLLHLFMLDYKHGMHICKE